jgi:formylglycine-generating enzyme required for sulfatase activity
VKVTGPAGFSDEGGLPWEGAGLRGGEYRVEVSRKGYAKLEQRVTVAAGKTETVKVDLKKESEAGGSCPTGMAAIPGGSFTPGERPVEVTVQPFCMDLTEVTVEAYSGCAKSGKCSARDISKKCNLNLKGGGKEQHPMNCVDWEQARAFCDAQGKRLPTDEEWEWAARGGEEAREFPWSAKATGEAPFGPQPGAQLCWNGDGNDLGKKRRKGTCQVGSYPASDNRWGVHDLAGNVWEWTASKSETDADQRGFRGGGWDTPEPARIRVAKRNWIKASYRENDLGFRCVKSR